MTETLLRAEELAKTFVVRRGAFREGLTLAVIPLRPHADDAARTAAVREMATEAPDLVLLDCISYTRRDKAVAVAGLSCPVLLSVTVAARAAASLLPEA